MMKFAYWILNNFTEIVSCPLLSMATMKMDCILKHLASIFKVLVPNFKAKPKMYNGLLFLQKIDYFFVLNFQGDVFGLTKG